MAEYKKRETAHKLRIGDILLGTPIVEDIPQEVSPDPTQAVAAGATKERFRFLEIGDRRVVRINLIANVIETYNSEGEKKYSSVTIDDATGQIRIKAFGEDVNMLTNLSQGDTITIIGVLRSYNREIYIMPEIIRKTDPKYLLVRKLEIEGKKALAQSQSDPAAPKSTDDVKSVRDQVVEAIRAENDSGGVSTESLILKIKSASPELINSEIMKLLEDGMVYEPRPGMVRWLG